MSTMRKQPSEIEWWGSEGLKRGGAQEEEEEGQQADSIYRGGEWLEGVSGRRIVAGPPLIKRIDSDDTAAARIPDIVSGVVMNYNFLQVDVSSFVSFTFEPCNFVPCTLCPLNIFFCMITLQALLFFWGGDTFVPGLICVL